MKDRDISILWKIVDYANEIEGTIIRFELDLNKFENDYVVKNAISMCLLQIGELVGKLTDEFKLKYSKMEWRDIVSIRNRAAHTYGSMDIEILWNIAESDVPKLKCYCESIIEEKSDSD